MTKLEEKLIQLGYEKGYFNVYHRKQFNGMYWLILEVYGGNIFGSIYSERREFRYQNQIDDLQLAYNQLQKDLKELKEYGK